MTEIATLFIAIAAWCGEPSKLGFSYRASGDIQKCRTELLDCLDEEAKKEHRLAKCFRDRVYK